MSLDRITWDTPLSLDLARMWEPFNFQSLARHENVILCGAAGVGKTCPACALGHGACRAVDRVPFVKVARRFQVLHQSPVDNSSDWALRSWVAMDLLFLDDFGLRKLTAQHSSDFYEDLVE